MMDPTGITLDMRVPNTGIPSLDETLPPRTLADCFAELKRKKINKLFTEAEFDEGYNVRLDEFLTRIRRGEVPTIGQIITAWHFAANAKNLADYIAPDSQVTTKQYDARRGGITRQVISKR